MAISLRKTIFTSRRTFLHVAAALPMVIGSVPAVQLMKRGDKKRKFLDWRTFIGLVDELANRQYDQKWDQHAHVERVSELARALNLNDSPFEDSASEYMGKQFGRPRFTELEARTAFEVKLITFEQGERINHHNHPGMTGVIICAVGELYVDSYEVDGKDEESGGYLLRKRKDTVLTPGDVSTLTARRSNIHRVVARTDCQIIDIFTPPYSVVRNAATKWYDVDSSPTKEGLFRAVVR